MSALSVSATLTILAYYQRLWFKEMHYTKHFSGILKHQTNYTFTVLLNQGNMLLSSRLHQYRILTTIIIHSGDYLPYSSQPSMRIVAAFWCLVAIVLINAYQGTLTSFLAIPRLSPVPQSLEQLVASGRKYKLAAEINAATTEAYYVRELVH